MQKNNQKEGQFRTRNRNILESSLNTYGGAHPNHFGHITPKSGVCPVFSINTDALAKGPGQ